MKYTRHTEALRALGAHVRSLRRARGWSQEELANRCDLELSQISRIERGVINTSVSQLISIADALGVTLSELVDFPLRNGH